MHATEWIFPAVVFLLLVVGAVLLVMTRANRRPVREKSERRVSGKARGTMILNFHEDTSLTWDAFASILTSAGGGPSPRPEELIYLTEGAELEIALAPGVSVDVDLEGRGRFLTLAGGTCTITGSDARLTVLNGVGRLDTGASGTNGGGFRVESGSLRVQDATLRCLQCKAEMAGGAYVLGGHVTLDGAAKLVLESCQATRFAGGGISVWEGKVSIAGTGAAVEAISCESGDAGGGIIVFRGVVELSGADSVLRARGCSAGLFSPHHGFGGGIAFSDATETARDDRYVDPSVPAPRLVMRNRGAHIEADSCSSVGGAAIAFDRAIIETLYEDNRVIATNNTASDIVSGAMLPSSSAVLFYDTLKFKYFDLLARPKPSLPLLLVQTKQNLCADMPCGAELAHSLEIIDEDVPRG